MSDVLNKIRAETPKKRGPLARARRARTQDATGLTKKATDLLAHYLPRAAKAWVDGLSAKKVVWNSDKKDYELTNYPDHKIRAECAEKIWHNVVGRPIERSMEVTGNYKELSQVLEELKQSPEARRLLPPEIWGMASGQSNVKGKDVTHEGEAISRSEQKTR
jgi:hypothetical protein